MSFPPPAFSVEVQTDGKWARLAARGELDLATVAEFEEALNRCRASGSAVLLDLESLEFIDSTGIRAILSAVTTAKSNGWDLGIAAHMEPAVLRAFEVSGVLATLPLIEK